MSKMKPNLRYHSLDGLRAVMMLLGLVLHAAASYIATPVGEGWPYSDVSRSVLFDFVLFYIHVFRMPIFYVIAGFFAALLYLRRGAPGLARNRVARVLVPFVIFWIILLPITNAGFTFANVAQAGTLSDGWAAAVQQVTSLAFLQDSTIHLWFLYYLLLFYATVLIGGPVLLRLPAAFRAVSMRLFGAALASAPLRPLVFAIPTAACLLTMPTGSLQTSTSFIPDARTYFAYVAFFGFGWLLYERRDLLDSFQRYAWTQVALATLMAPLNVAAVTRAVATLPNPDVMAHTTAAISGALMVWLLVFGITGLFLRYADRPSPTVRYVVDSSYWLYLCHLPFTIWIPGLMTHQTWPAQIKFLIVLVVMTPILLISYDLLVRPTRIGVLLNGRRYPRGLPELDADGQPTFLDRPVVPAATTPAPSTGQR